MPIQKDILNLEEFEVISCEQQNEDYLFNVRPLNPTTICPSCGSVSSVNNGTYNRFVRDLNYFEYKVGIHILGNRHKCKDCGVTFVDMFDCIETNAKITIRLRDKIRQDAMRRPFLQIANDYGLTVQTIKRVFMNFVAEEEEKRVLYSPEILGIDEAHLNKVMRAVIVDVKERKIIEMLENRSKDRVIEYFTRLPNADRIKVVTMDMWRPYAEAVREALPYAHIVIDRFHVVKAANEALDTVRKRIVEQIKRDGTRINIKNLRYLLLTNFEDLSPNQSDELDAILDKYPTLSTAYTLKEGLRNLYFCDTAYEAEKLFESWCRELPDDLEEFQKIKRMVNNWHDEIFNYFRYRYTNGICESLNNIIKSIERIGRGYTYDVLRAKVMFTTSATKPAKYSFRKPTSKKSGPPNGSYGFSMGGMIPDVTYKEYKESKVLDCGTGVDMAELEEILNSGDF